MADFTWVGLIRHGLAADRPTAPDVVPLTIIFYFATDTRALSAWVDGAWIAVKLGT